jgi:ubiquinone/menaquinone biosynthesis C-methylase UbiE
MLLTVKTNTEWREWGKQDPLFGVASWTGRQKGGERPWTDAEFYALGSDWLDFIERWERYRPLQVGTILEIGCGAGRITKRLADDFHHVLACDVSEGMLAYARERVTAPNIQWHLSEGTRLPADDNSVDAVFSCHVLQHFEHSAAQLECFREIYRVLKPGGTFMVHMPLHTFPLEGKFSKLARAGYQLNIALAILKSRIKRAVGRMFMRGISHETAALFAALQQIGFSQVEFVTFPVRTNNHLHPCVLGTKP